MVGHFLRSANAGQRFEDGIARGAVGGKDLRGFVTLFLALRQAKQKMLGGNILIFEIVGFFESLIDYFGKLVGKMGLRRA